LQGAQVADVNESDAQADVRSEGLPGFEVDSGIGYAV